MKVLPPPPNFAGEFHEEGSNLPVKWGKGGAGHFNGETKSSRRELELAPATTLQGWRAPLSRAPSTLKSAMTLACDQARRLLADPKP